MKNYIIVFLVVCLAVSLSFIYKQNQKHPLLHFPVENLNHTTELDNPFHMVLFFSKQNCKDCLGMIETLNNLKEPFIVTGIVPPHETENEKEIREITGATFRLLPGNKFQRYAPLYAPTLMGVSQKGRIIFVIPGVPAKAIEIENFLTSLYNKAYSTLLL